LVRRECGQGTEYARPVGFCEAGAEAQTLIQGSCWVVVGSAHRCAFLVRSAYAVSLTGHASVGDERCRQRGAHARDRARLGRVFVGPDTTVCRVEGSRSLRVCSEYLGIDTTAAQLPAGRQLLLAPAAPPFVCSSSDGRRSKMTQSMTFTTESAPRQCDS
jgi:hypothetical protein